MSAVSMEGGEGSVYNKKIPLIKDDKSRGKKDKKMPSQLIPSPQVGDFAKIKDKKIKQLAKRDIERKTEEQFLSIRGSGSRRADANSLRTTSISSQEEESDVEVGDSSEEVEGEFSLESVKDEISLLENKYKELSESLRMSKASVGALLTFIEKLNDKKHKLSYGEQKHIIDNIFRLCKEREDDDPGSDTNLYLGLITHYAKYVSAQLLEFQFSPHPDVTYVSKVTPVEKNKKLLANLVSELKQQLENRGITSSKLTKIVSQLSDDNYFNDIHKICERYLTEDQQDAMMIKARRTQIDVEKIRSKLGAIERTPMTLANSSRAKTGILCSLLSEVINDQISLQKQQLEMTFNKIKSLKEEMGLDVGLEEIQHKAGKESLDPLMREVYAKRFSPYVAEEMERQRAIHMVNHLIDLGNRLELQQLKSKLSSDDLSVLGHMRSFAQQKLEKIPIIEPQNDNSFMIDTDVITKSWQGEKISKHRVSILPTPLGKWVVTLVHYGKKETHTFDKYSQAAEWVHIRLDKEFIENMGVDNKLLEIVQASRLLQTIADWAKTTAQNVGNRIENFTTGSTMVNPGMGVIPVDNLSVLGNIGDIVSLALILPSIFMALEAHEKKEARHELLNKISAYEDSMNNNIIEIDKLLKKYKHLNIPLSSSTTKQKYKKFEEKLIAKQNELRLQKKSKTPNKQAEIETEREALESIIDLLHDNLTTLSRIEAAKTHCRDLEVEEVEKATAATTNIIGVLAAFSNTAIALHQLYTTGSYAVTVASGASIATAQAALSLGVITGACFSVAGGVQAVIDMGRMDKNRNAKRELKDLFKELENAKNTMGENILSEKDRELVNAVRKMQTRIVNNAIASGAISIGSDLSLIGVGGASMAVAAGALCPPALVAIPFVAALTIGIKVGRNKIVKALADKEQEAYVLHDPSKSDIGLIHALRMRIQQDDAGAKLITEKLIEGIIKISKDDFLKMTEEFEEKFIELEQMVT